MTGHDYGPLRTYEVTWLTRAPEIVQGHQVTFDSMGFMHKPGPSRFYIHGEFDGHWRMVPCGPEEQVAGIRDITDQVAALEAMAATDGQEGGTP